MGKGKRALLYLAAGGMELSWLYAAAAFFMSLTGFGPFPPLEAILIFLLAALLTRVVKGRGWRVILVLFPHLAGLTAGTLWSIYTYFDWSGSFLQQDWLLQLFTGPYDLFQGFYLALLILWPVLFWIGGFTLARRSTAYKTIGGRFDLGVVAFLLLFIIKGAVKIEFPTLDFLLFAFFLFSMAALALSRNQDTKDTRYLARYKGMGVLLAVAAIGLLIGTAVLLLFLPYLTVVADTGVMLLKKVAKPVSTIFARIILFIFGFGSRHGGAGPSEPGAENIPDNIPPGVVESSWWAQLLENIMGWGFLGLAVICFLILAVYGLWHLYRWLISRTAGAPVKEEPCFWEQVYSWLRLWWLRLKTLFLSLGEALFTPKRRQSETVRLYERLLLWGSAGGFPRHRHQTPWEYGAQLSRYFPALKTEIELILECFNREIYGGELQKKEELAPARQAWRNLCSPRQWPLRWRTWVSGPMNRKE